MQVFQTVNTVFHLEDHVIIPPVTLLVLAVIKFDNKWGGDMVSPNPKSRDWNEDNIKPSPSVFGFIFDVPSGKCHWDRVVRCCLKMHSSCPIIISGLESGGLRTLRYPPWIVTRLQWVANDSWSSTWNSNMVSPSLLLYLYPISFLN
mmetsp:Transcript_20238/g.30375  ORF Transcript_20238/g.30375 Transcript_20238/m.30375 type:complete len:147 (+) Transcript_20238:292-732(+)